MTTRSANNSNSAPVNRRLAPPTHPPPVPLRNNESPNGYFFAPPLSSPLTHITPYDYFFSMYDEDIGDLRQSENLLGSNAFQVTGVTRTVAYDSRRPYERAIVVARPPGFAGSSLAASGSRIHALLLENPRTREILGGRWTPASPRHEADSSRLTYNEQRRALQKLRKEVYNPVRRISPRVNLYYRGTTVQENEIENNGKRCAICLEDFEPTNEVMLTPCNHMFHEECIVRWVKSNGRCPVCRFGIYE